MLAAVNAHLHGLDDFVLFGEIFALGHAEDSRDSQFGGSTAKRRAKSVANVGQYAKGMGSPVPLPDEIS